MRTASLGLTLLAGLVILGSAFSATDQEPESATLPERSFTITSDPTEPVVSMKSRSGSSNNRSNYTLYGDGRFVHEAFTGSGDLFGSWELTLPFDELRELVAIAVDHGLMETDDGQIETRRKALVRQDLDPRRGGVTVSDEGWLALTIYLATYTRDDQTTKQVIKTFKPKYVMVFETVFPEIPEYAGLAEFLRRLNSIALQAETQGAAGNS